jgi:glycerate dehydrogenase
MKAVFLDFATMGADALDPSPLFAVAPEMEIFDSTADGERADRIRAAELVFTNKVKLNRALLDSARSLKFIGLTATGTDNIDLVHAEQLGVAVCNIRAYCTQSVVEHVFAVMLNLAHSIGRYDRSVKDGEWQRAQDFCMLMHPIRELSAMTLGIIGHGELGKGVERIARQFNMNVVIAGRHGAAAKDGRIDFDELLECSDVISLHCPLNEDTLGLFGEAQFRRMKDNAILINTARGGLVRTDELVAALRNGEIGAAAIDVLAQEPPVDGDPLLDYTGDNLIVTPHIAWATEEARQNAINELAANVRAFLDGKRRNRVV